MQINDYPLQHQCSIYILKEQALESGTGSVEHLRLSPTPETLMYKLPVTPKFTMDIFTKIIKKYGTIFGDVYKTNIVTGQEKSEITIPILFDAKTHNTEYDWIRQIWGYSEERFAVKTYMLLLNISNLKSLVLYGAVLTSVSIDVSYNESFLQMQLSFYPSSIQVLPNIIIPTSIHSEFVFLPTRTCKIMDYDKINTIPSITGMHLQCDYEISTSFKGGESAHGDSIHIIKDYKENLQITQIGESNTIWNQESDFSGVISFGTLPKKLYIQQMTITPREITINESDTITTTYNVIPRTTYQFPNISYY